MTMLTSATFLTRNYAMPAVSERRRGLRIRQARPVKLFDPVGGRFYGGSTLDVSTSGLRIQLPLHAGVRPGSEICLHVGLNDRGQTLANRRQMIPARVIWVANPGSRQKMLTVGVEFSASLGARMDAA
jgi:hypothetical protein